MADYLLTEVQVSSDEKFENIEVIDSVLKVDLDFINDYDSVRDDVGFYRLGKRSCLQITFVFWRVITRPWSLFSKSIQIFQ